MPLLLSACLSNGDEDTHWVGKIQSDITISGSVGDGPAINANVRIRSKSGEQLATFKSDASGSYAVDIKVSDKQLPLLVDATGGTDIVTNAAPDFVLLGAVLSASSRVTANVNPFSTFAYEMAADMNGGLTKGNLLAAESIVVSSLNSGLTTLAAQGPMQTPVTAGNVAEMIKSSETLAEIVRRTRDALNAAGRSASGDSVLQALSSDLIDTLIEGNGGPRADSRVAAVANVAMAQVLLEAMMNELHVNGVDATDAMRRAVGQVVPGTVAPTLDQLTTTAGMIDSANAGLAAAYAITGDQTIFDLMQSVAGVQPGMEPALVRTLIPANYRSTLNGAVAMAASGDTSVVDTINDVVRSGDTSVGGENRAPTISGQPATSVRAGSAYDFTPTASDLDGDALTFSISAQPGWASFDPTSGRLWGTPSTANARSYEGITITVSDGNLSNSVGPFTITVTTANSGPTITGTPATTVTAGDAYTFTPNASDPDSTVLRFDIAGKPAWADFDVLSGQLSGTPAEAHVGLYQGITISVTDGTFDASLAPFSIEVLAAGAATGSVTLNWTPPTENEDGTQLMDLAGYRLYWSRNGGAYNPPVTINNPSVTRYFVDNLAPGTYEFVATSLNGAGVESRFSNAITKIVQ
jgi:hypothetical protein